MCGFLSVHGMSDDVTRETLVCIACGRPLRVDAPEGLCPVCVLTLGSGSAGDPSVPTLSTGPSSDETDETSTRLQPGGDLGRLPHRAVARPWRHGRGV